MTSTERRHVRSSRRVGEAPSWPALARTGAISGVPQTPPVSAALRLGTPSRSGRGLPAQRCSKSASGTPSRRRPRARTGCASRARRASYACRSGGGPLRFASILATNPNHGRRPRVEWSSSKQTQEISALKNSPQTWHCPRSGSPVIRQESEPWHRPSSRQNWRVAGQMVAVMFAHFVLFARS